MLILIVSCISTIITVPNYHAKIGDGDRDCGVFPLRSERILRHVGTFLGGPHAQSVRNEEFAQMSPRQINKYMTHKCLTWSQTVIFASWQLVLHAFAQHVSPSHLDSSR